ncbi:alpha-N-acetylglucosaminidase [Galendromus occidentalis]|uniref:Alpha-N-acetylglucosaminidase n=1 Tax=Galendromus occidentalis TaxID=34638 RepID=A0AAJ6QTN0_9ACAR|nr:alpha-N-acetylglucosaminidase [Galendromus occidentalis]
MGIGENPTSREIRDEEILGLLERVVEEGSPIFELRVDPSLKSVLDGKEGFRVEGNSTKIFITGTVGYAAANGLNFYIRKLLGGQFSWSGKRIPLPEKMPAPQRALLVTLPDQVRYYENVCTASYSFVWWQWPRWQREIDWMAMNGINLPLAFSGQEIVAAEVFKTFGCNDTDLATFFSGPAFLSWNRMGNLRGFGGPLPSSWQLQQQLLQKMILRRMRDFGMTPVVPGFNGFVPRAFERLHPAVSWSRASRWNNFPDEYAMLTFLAPTESFFLNVSSLYITMYRSIYGSDHLYSVDLFNEETPDTNDPAALAEMSSNVYESIAKADPKGIWVMQGWLFVHGGDYWNHDRVKAFLGGPPLGKMIVLDLFSEQSPQFPRFSNYFGQPFIWCMLHNYGGVSGLFGNLEWINSEPLNVRRSVPNMIGIGIAPEGTGQNEVIYEFMAENSYRDSSENVSLWLQNYVGARYGLSDPHLENAWELLRKSVYSLTSKSIENHGNYILTHRPKLNSTPLIWYNGSDVIGAATELIRGATLHRELCHERLFHQDLVDVVRQALQVRVSDEYLQMMSHFKANSLIDFEEHSRRLLHCIRVLDKVLSTDPNFLLGSWLRDSRESAGLDRDLQDQFEFNARNQITRWGPNGEIVDYASKMWNGLVRDYFGKRWQVFVDALNHSLRTGTRVDERQLEHTIIREVELPFTESRRKYPHTASGNVCRLRQWIQRALHPI